MISIKHISLLLLSGFLLVSCAPFPPGKSRVDPKTVPEVPKVEEKKKKTAAELKREADRRKARAKKRKADAKRRAEARRKKAEEKANGLGSATNDTGSASDSPTATKPKPKPKPKAKRRTAVRIPGKEGYVFNPWTNKAVDVRSIPSGQLVRDPKDPDPTHIFRVP